jgi:hypothetical protein
MMIESAAMTATMMVVTVGADEAALVDAVADGGCTVGRYAVSALKKST